MLRLRAGIGVVLLATACVDCGLSNPVLISEEPELKALRSSRPRPLAWNVELLPVVAAPAMETEKDFWPLEVNGAALGDGIVAALKEGNVFAAVGNAGSCDAELSLRIKVNAAKARYLGGNGYRISWFLVWCVLSSVPASFIADEEYEAQMDVEASLADKSTGATLWCDHIAVKFAGALDHFQRGISLWDLFLPGPFLTGADPGCLSQVLVPHLARRLELELAKRLTAAVPPKQVDLLLAVGACDAPRDPQREAGKAPAFIVSDTRAFAEAFAKREGRIETVLLLGEAATCENFRHTLDAYKKRGDLLLRDLVVFFAGTGTVIEAGRGKAEAALVFAVAKPGSPDRENPRILRLSEALELVEAVPAESRLVIIDAGFTGPDGRVATGATPEVPATATILPFPAARALPALLTACGPSETAFESPEFGAGLFSHFLVASMVRDSDVDGDGIVTVREVFENLSWDVLRESRFLGNPSTPLSTGGGVLFRCKPRLKTERDR
jgi:hypothetical protein